MLVFVLCLVIAIDFAVVSAGAFRFNIDESVVWVRGDGRPPIQAPTRLQTAPDPGPMPAQAFVPPLTVTRHAIGRSVDPPAPRARLLVAADGDRSADPH
jgi:hypothetical protein